VSLQSLQALHYKLEANFLAGGPIQLWYEQIEPQCHNPAYTGNPNVQPAPFRDCNDTGALIEKQFWSDLSAHSKQEIKNHPAGFYVDRNLERHSEIYLPAWGPYYDLAGSIYPAPAIQDALVPAIDDLNQICAAKGWSYCATNKNASCPSYCAWPSAYNNSFLVYERIISQQLINDMQVYFDAAKGDVIWFWSKAAKNNLFRMVPAFSQIPIFWWRTSGDDQLSDSVIPFPSVDPAMGASKTAVVWNPPLIDPVGRVLMFASAPLYVGGEFFGAAEIAIALAQVNVIVRPMQATQGGMTMLADLRGTLIGASDTTLAFIFCPKSPLCVYQNSTKSWLYKPITGITFSTGGGLQNTGPMLSDAVATYPELNDVYLRTIAMVSTGSNIMVLSGKEYYISWTALPDATLFSGNRVVQIISRNEIDDAVIVSVAPTDFQLSATELTVTTTLSNIGLLTWQWSAVYNSSS